MSIIVSGDIDIVYGWTRMYYTLSWCQSDEGIGDYNDELI